MKEDTDRDPLVTRELPGISPQSREKIAGGSQGSGSGSGRLEVRCPDCHQPTDVAADTTLTDLTCSACGSHFSLVDQSQATRMAPSLTQLGRFDLIERLGVGGFGSVWKARDKELDRTVAIKIPRAGGMTPEQQEKFFREARAAAQLRHPRIVSVHEVGRDGDSVYIVSDFVRGVTLGDWLTGQQLTSREAAELCSKIADALHHAHEHGIVHRDLKPANVIMDYDGEPHLMDFGLARRESGEVTVTMDGQLVGTPAYMSPEQAQGEAHTADRRSDIYSLGVILFQLLTGELPFRGNARMLVKQVIQDEPPSPRKLNGSIPKDLETITLKCLEKEPNRRYQTAEDLQAELKRFLSGEPIHARPIGRAERVWRWSQRYPLVASLSAIIAATLILGTVISTWQAIRATRAEGLARQRLEAETKAREEATAARSEAQANLQKALAAVDSMLTEVGEKSLADVPQMEPVRRVLLEKALGFYQEFLQKKSDEPRVRLEAARAYQRVSNIYYMLGQHVQAEQSCREAIAIFASLESQFPVDTNYRFEVAESYARLGWLYGSMGEQIDRALERAETAYRQAVDRYEKLAADHPDEPKYRHAMANSYGAMANRVLTKRRAQDAETAFRRAIDLHKSLAETSPALPEYRESLSNHYGELAEFIERLGRQEQAGQLLNDALLLQRALAAEYPRAPSYRRSLALNLQRQGKHLNDDPHEAAPAFRESIALQEKLVEDFPTVWDYRFELTATTLDFGAFLRRNGRPEDAKTQFVRAAEVYLPTVRDRAQMARDFPAEKGHHIWLASSYNRLGGMFEAAGRTQDAIEAYENSAQAREALVKLLPKENIHQFSIVAAKIRVGSLLAATGHHDEADKAYQRAAHVLGEISFEAGDQDPLLLNNVAWKMATLANPQFRDSARAVKLAKSAVEMRPKEGMYWNTLGAAYYGNGDWKSAIEILSKSADLRHGGDSFDFFFLAMAHWQRGDFEQAHKWYDKAVAWMDKNQPSNEELVRLRSEAEALMTTLPAKKDGESPK